MSYDFQTEWLESQREFYKELTDKYPQWRKEIAADYFDLSFSLWLDRTNDRPNQATIHIQRVSGIYCIGREGNRTEVCDACEAKNLI